MMKQWYEFHRLAIQVDASTPSKFVEAVLKPIFTAIFN